MGASLRQPLAAALLTLVAVVLGLGVPTAAHAGPEINIPRADDGPGIKAGQRSTFHTGAALVVGVDSNVFSTARSEPRGADVGPAPAAFIMPTGWLGIGNRKFRDGLLMSPPERSGRLADYYFGGIVGARQYLARNRNILRQRMPSFGLQARLALLPGRRFSVNFDGDVFRYAQPATYEAQPEYNFNRVDGRGRLLFIGRPGGGRFSIAMGPRFAGLRFDNATGDEDIAKGNRIVPGLGTELKWRFLPKSAVVLDYGMDFTYYTQCCVDVGSGRNEDNFAHRITAGYRGQVLKKLTLDAIAGYGLGFYRQDPNGPNFSSFIGDLAVSYFPNPRSVFHVGVYRSFQDSLLGNYYVDVGARVQARYEFKWRMVGSVGAWVAGRRYAGLPVPGEEDDDIIGYTGRGADRFQRRDTVVSMVAKVEQPLGRLFSVALQYDLAVDATTFQTSFANGAVDIGGFTRHVVMLFGAVRI